MRDQKTRGDSAALDLLLSLATPNTTSTTETLTPDDWISPTTRVGVRLVTAPQLDQPSATTIQRDALKETKGNSKLVRSHRGPRRSPQISIPLIAVLVLQAAMSLRLIWSNSAFNDEALYLWAGRLELAHIMYGTPVPAFQTYFSGAPVIYPPLGALADRLGGLAAARMLSLAFMLGATVLLYGATRKMFGRRAGGIASASFALLGPTQFIGALATYDAMALFMLALAAWFIVMACGRGSEPLLILAGLALALANATKYPTILWDPIVVALAALTAAEGGWLRGGLRAVRLVLYTGTAITVALLFYGEHPYMQGLFFTTLARHHAGTPIGSILRDSACWVGLILVIALRGLVIADNTRTRLTCAILACAVALAPLEQARIHTQTSLDKHVAFGAWFGAIAVGYVLAHAVDTSKYSGWRIPVGTLGIILLIGIPQATSFYASWPRATAAVSEVRRLTAADPTAPIFAEQGQAIDYYLDLPPRQVTNDTGGFWYWDPLQRKEVHGLRADLDAIQNHYFSIIELDFSFSGRGQVDKEVMATMRSAGGYKLLKKIPWTDRFGHSNFLIWKHE